jgi:hypothetical protein
LSAADPPKDRVNSPKLGLIFNNPIKINKFLREKAMKRDLPRAFRHPIYSVTEKYFHLPKEKS